MARLLKNQCGSVFLQVLVAASLSGILFGTLARFVTEQSQAEAVAQQKTMAQGLQQAMKLAFTDVDSCSCFFDGTSSLNGVRKDLKVDLQATRDRQRGGVTGPSLPLRWLSKIPVGPSGLCDYGRATAVALPGELVDERNEGLRVSRVEIENLRLVSPMAKSQNLYHLRGILTVSFQQGRPGNDTQKRKLASHQIRPVATEVNFFADSDGVARTCDSQLQLQGLTLGNVVEREEY